MKKGLWLTLEGAFALGSGPHPIDLRFEKSRALMVLLVAKGQSIERQEAARLLWPDLDPLAARNNLRISLHRLKAAFEAAHAPWPIGSDRMALRLQSNLFRSLPDAQNATRWLQARGFWGEAPTATQPASARPLVQLMALYGFSAPKEGLWPLLLESLGVEADRLPVHPQLVCQDEGGWRFCHPLFRRGLLLSQDSASIEGVLLEAVNALLKLAQGAIKGHYEWQIGTGAAAKALALLRHLEKSPRTLSLRVDLDLVLASLLQHRRGLGCKQAVALLDRAATLAGGLGLIDRVFAAFFNRWQASLVGSDPWIADESARRLEALAAQNQSKRAAALLAMGRNHMVSGDIVQARHLLSEAHRIVQAHDGRIVMGGIDVGVVVLASLSMTHWLLGHFDKAAQSAREALALGDESEAISRCVCAAAVGSYYRLDGRNEELSLLANEGMVTASRAQLPFWQMTCFFQNIWTLIQSGQHEAVTLLKGRLESMQSALGDDRMAYSLAVLESYFETGRYGLCAQACQQAIEQGLCEQEVFRSEYYRLWARALAKLGSHRKEVEARYQKGLEFADYFQSPALKLSLVLDRAYYLISQKEIAAARSILAEALKGFEPGGGAFSPFLLRCEMLLERLKKWEGVSHQA